MLHRDFTLDARLESSPEENLRKKLTGSDKMRIITDASTAWEVLVLTRFISSERIRPIICAAKALLKRNAISPSIRFMFRLVIIDPVTRLYTLGSTMPIKVAASVASAIRM